LVRVVTSVSVVIPVYNHRTFVEGSIRSVAEQDYSDIEIICVDDGSSDGSVEVVHQVLASLDRPTILVSQANQGAHVALNRGASMAEGDLLMFLNSDDMYLPGRIQSFVHAFSSQGAPKDFWGFSCCSFINDRNEAVNPADLGVPKLAQYNRWAFEGVWVKELFTWHNLMLASGNLVVTPSLFRSIGGFRWFRMVHDWDCALRLLAVTPPSILTSTLYAYRLHVSNTFRSIADDDAFAESALARATFETLTAATVRSEPYARRGTPVVDFLRMAVPMRAGQSSN
jgi:glycosyltransferase involved in cell wall biosynthesis